MNAVRNIIQIVAGLLIVTLPFIFIYWLLLAVNLEPLSGLTNLLGSIFNPFIEILKVIPFIKSLKPLNFTGKEVDLVPLMLFISVFILSSVLSAVSQMLVGFQRSVREIKAKTIIEANKQVVARERQREEEETLQNNTCFMIIRLVIHKTSSAYLISSGLSEEDVIGQFKELIYKYKYLNANMVKTDQENEFRLVFDEVVEAVNYATNLITNLKEFNKTLGQAAAKCVVHIGLHASKPGKQRIFEVTEKVVNLAGENEIVCSKIVHDVYCLMKRESPLEFFSKGMYTLEGETEIFLIKTFK